MTAPRSAFPGFVATLMGIGFSRFSFTPVSALEGLLGTFSEVLAARFVMLVSTRLVELAGAQNTTRGWAMMTGGFAVGQLAGAIGMAAGYGFFDRYQPLFVIGGMLEAVGLGVLVICIRIFPLKQKGQLT